MTANDLLDSLRHAMWGDRDGYRFYSMAAKQAVALALWRYSSIGRGSDVALRCA